VSSLSVLASVWREGSDNDLSYLAQLGDLPTKSIKGEKSPSADEDTVDTSTARPLRHPIKRCWPCARSNRCATASSVLLVRPGVCLDGDMDGFGCPWLAHL
jgi:hypothetical protein